MVLISEFIRYATGADGSLIIDYFAALDTSTDSVSVFNLELLSSERRSERDQP